MDKNLQQRGGFSTVWNNSLVQRENFEPKARDRIWASELGKSPVDVWLKMKGTVPTNPPNARALRKFEAGNIWEWIVELILLRAGVLQDAQRWTSYQYPGLLEVSGKLDFVAGGKPQYAEGERSLEELRLPEIFLRGGRNIIKYFAEHYPDGLPSTVLEVKSVSSFMYDAFERTGRSSANHRMQTFHYLKAENMPKGEIVYVCRDDCRMMEVPILNPGEVENEYKGAIEELTKYYDADERPPLEKPLTFEEDSGKFSKNWKIEYSSYLTMLYGFKKPMEFADKYKGTAERWNRVLGRMKEGKPMTANNSEALAEIEKAGFDIEAVKKTVENLKDTTDEAEQKDE